MAAPRCLMCAKSKLATGRPKGRPFFLPGTEDEEKKMEPQMNTDKH
jgi:hypothetical protein